jgi:hypothetical protein
VIATVDIADLGAAGTVRSLLRRPKPANVPGLRWAEVVVTAQLAATRPPALRRAALLAFWDDEDAAQQFAHTHPIGRRFAGGFHASLRPLRAFGAWPGLPPDLTDARAVPHDGPVMVLTLGQLHPTQIVRFLRTSRPAERAAKESSGMLWGTASARPPFFATISMWRDSAASMTYAFGRGRPDHSAAIAEQQRKDFHRRSAFVRFAPIRVEGSLGGPNPIPATILT